MKSATKYESSTLRIAAWQIRWWSSDEDERALRIDIIRIEERGVWCGRIEISDKPPPKKSAPFSCFLTRGFGNLRKKFFYLLKLIIIKFKIYNNI